LAAGIAAANYSHVGYFPSRDEYDKYYEFLLRIVDISFEGFATRMQDLLVDHLTEICESTGKWFRDNWTGPRGRYCLCHATHGGSNNNMGVEVGWRDVKKICPPTSNLGTFLGALFHFVKELGKEHRTHLINCNTPNAFISTPVISKAIFDLMQDVHPKTLICTLLLTASGRDPEKRFFERMHEIMALCENKTPLHLKIRAWHTNNKRLGVTPGPPRIENCRELLMPRQHLLKTIDPDGNMPVGEVIARLDPLARQYEQCVINNDYEQVLDLHDSLTVYESFHHLQYVASWGPVPYSCSCEGSHADAVCEHAALVTAIFDPEVEVPKAYEASEPGLRKKCHKLKGTAGPRRQRLLAEIAKGKKKTASKLGHMSMEGSGPSSASKAKDLPAEDRPTSPPPPFVIPEPSLPSDSDFEVSSYHLIGCIQCADMGDRTRVGLAVPCDLRLSPKDPRLSPGPRPNPRQWVRNRHCRSRARHLLRRRSLPAAPPRR
jgi:hypothetical protein